mmetsp:Transcript_154020/g.493740  ORF Transcript_154020/g.493740 Transcript_154020/m.493740 type:complete len:210 (+) Transcript_154020:392-1021(+)
MVHRMPTRGMTTIFAKETESMVRRLMVLRSMPFASEAPKMNMLMGTAAEPILRRPSNRNARGASSSRTSMSMSTPRTGWISATMTPNSEATTGGGKIRFSATINTGSGLDLPVIAGGAGGEPTCCICCGCCGCCCGCCCSCCCGCCCCGCCFRFCGCSCCCFACSRPGLSTAALGKQAGPMGHMLQEEVSGALPPLRELPPLLCRSQTP